MYWSIFNVIWRRSTCIWT